MSPARQPSAGNDEAFVFIQYRILVEEDLELSDEFLWPVKERDVKAMKMFALSFLADSLSPESLHNLGHLQVSGFASFVAYLINREIDLADQSISLSPYNLVKDGLGGSLGEVLVPITLKFKDFDDHFLWDLANPDNRPSEFASHLVADLNLGKHPAQKMFCPLVTPYESRKQRLLFACKRIARFAFIFENYAESQLKSMLAQQAQPNYDDPEARVRATSAQVLYPGSSLREGQAAEKAVCNSKAYPPTENELIFGASFSDQLPQPFLDFSTQSTVTLPDFLAMSRLH